MTDEEVKLLKTKLNEEIKKKEAAEKEITKYRISGVLFYYFPEFEHDYEKLLKHNVIAITVDNELKWLYSKSSLCLYFNDCACDKRINWQLLEKIFGVTGLRAVSKKATETCKHYQKILKIIK